MDNIYKIGLDIGSTTIKAIVLSPDREIAFSRYERHNAQIQEKLLGIFNAICERLGDVKATVCLTGSVGMGVAERYGLPFIQEVVATTHYIRHQQNGIATLIDIGGEDAKIIFFKDNEATDLRMNGNCAGGTGAFIDQMAVLLNCPTGRMSELALSAGQIYPIASRCGVFSKTDVQNLIAKNISLPDIAASIFHAVAVQVVVTLAHGCEIQAPILFCGGPLTFLPALRKAFIDYLHLKEEDVVLPENSLLLPAWGAAWAADSEATGLSQWIEIVSSRPFGGLSTEHTLEPIFRSADEYESWKKRMWQQDIARGKLQGGLQKITLGIDSGSTTTKIVALNEKEELVFSFYSNNNGNPIATVERGLHVFQGQCRQSGTEIQVVGSCATGYGEDLIKAAFHLDEGIVETIAHYEAARHLKKDVSLILDIGGQDMKAMFVSGGVINRIEINEACSSGCGSFLETFAKTLGYTVQDFGTAACQSQHPYDLGTRCTVFMNSKVKQAMREGASVQDIAAGLSYSVIKNCLYKVLRLKSVDELGEHIVVQGGTMKNDSVVRAFEKLTGKQVFRSEYAELMGAIGCALHARHSAKGHASLDELSESAAFTSRQHSCHGCENQCLVTTYLFHNGNRYYSGNRCEKVFTNRGETKPGLNAYTKKLDLLFNRKSEVKSSKAVIGIPRCLNMYEEYPFWHTLFSRCGIEVVLSAPSSFPAYEEKAKLVMSDNICFPAKLVHTHIQNLIDRRVERVFMPFVVYEKLEGGQNSYNCPIVSSYSEVVKSVQGTDVPIDTPVITFKDRHLLYKQCQQYLQGYGIDGSTIKDAFKAACEAMEDFEDALVAYNREVLKNGREEHRLTILLAGRPYHTDPLIQHKLSDMAASMGVNVITDDIVRHEDLDTSDAHFLPQWAYANRILKAVKWVALQGEEVQCMQMTSFGCGPDAFLTDETRTLLRRYGKTLTLLKLDDINNIGSIKLRVRSAIESLKLAQEKTCVNVQPFVTTPPFRPTDRKRKILAPFFTPFISPLIPSLMKVAGYDVENLPMSDAASCDCGLRYANNEVCYPATLIVGDIVKALKSGKYLPEETAVAMVQTGGQCRASNYLSLIKKALAESGFQNIPVISLTFGGDLKNNQPGFKMNWFKMLPVVLDALLYSDGIAKFYYAAAVREKEKGAAARLKAMYLNAAQGLIERGMHDDLLSYLHMAARDFDQIASTHDLPKVGIVGEIFLKFNPFAQKDLSEWLVSRKIEVVPPLLTEFFVQGFVNYAVKQDSGLRRKLVPDGLIRWLYNRIWKRMEKFNRAGSGFRYFMPFNHVFEESAEASKVISLNAQFGEGWMLPAEILSMYRQGVSHVVSLQPFGCIANHIVSKGVENRIKKLCPDLHLLSLDFDSGVSDVNILNRLLLFIDTLDSKKDREPVSVQRLQRESVALIV